ncbi:MAG TPA: 4-(cytidine 5'-diphospho)-2-C-methyl-D-erythritol kinase [Thermodesulfobacteriota bacterium]|nr:4-(cytidine 5'-diphospho)-2-C-methyl-D-erythritol kinase [Thermodesulfobacteriota bacterium]
MNSITFLSPAKVNLTLEVLGKRPDGYHEIESIIQPINLFDKVKINLEGGEGIEIESKGLEIPKGEGNLAWRAASLFLKKSGLKFSVKISIEKKIPIGAGLGGGSSNAAAVLVGMNRLTKKFGEDGLINLSPTLGADAPFFIHSRSALVRGIGEKLTLIRNFPLFHYVLLNPGFEVSTKRIYELWDEMKDRELATEGKEITEKDYLHKGSMDSAAKSESIISLFRKGNFPLRNDLEEPALSLYPGIRSLKERLCSLEAEAVSMTGSGPTVFGVFRDMKKANVVYEYLRDSASFKVFLAQGISGWHRL